jgi:hypothetical protein
MARILNTFVQYIFLIKFSVKKNRPSQMESIGAKFNDLNISRSQSNHNLSCYV